jgi:hypothetical protein
MYGGRWLSEGLMSDSPFTLLEFFASVTFGTPCAVLLCEKPVWKQTLSNCQDKEKDVASHGIQISYYKLYHFHLLIHLTLQYIEHNTIQYSTA